jgi:CO dehydrogenase maturation factor
VVAVAGKGGVGKTTVSSLLVQLLAAEQGGTVLAVDADPNSNLAEKLGMEPRGSIGEIRNRIVEDPSLVPVSMSKHEYMALQMQGSLAEDERGIDLLVMGRPQGEGCYCFVNNVLRDTLNRMLPRYAFAVVDNEAGMEHLARRTLPQMDTLFLVSDPSATGVRTALRLWSMTRELGMQTGRSVLLLNGVRGPLPDDLIPQEDDLEVHFLPFDERVEAANRRGEPIVPDLESTLYQTLHSILLPVLR